MQSTPTLWQRVRSHPLMRLLMLGGTMMFLLGLTQAARQTIGPASWLSLVAVVAMAGLALWVYATLVQRTEQRIATEVAVPGLGRELAAGLALGALLYSLAIAVLWLLGCYRITGLDLRHNLLPALGMALASGVMEELVFRGALFRIVEQWLGSWVALAVSSLFFGLIHLLNPGSTLLAALFISAEAGVLLAAAFMLTRRLWLCIGIHIGWNFTQGGVFSGAVSGNAVTPGLVKATVDGPPLLTGGAFGTEASVVAFAVCLAAGLWMLRQAVRRGHLRHGGTSMLPVAP